MDAMDRATALLAEQHGVAHVAQLRRNGLTDARIQARLSSGSWAEVQPDVVAVRGGAETPLRRIWEAYVAAGTADDGTERPVAVGGLAAAFLHGAIPDPPPQPEVLVARGIAYPRPPGVRVREVRTWRTRGFVRRDGLLVTALPDTLVDVARAMDDATYLILLQDQCFGRPGLLARVVGLCRRGLAGSARARRVAGQLALGLDSPLHARAAGVLRAAGLSPSRCDAEVVAGAGPSDCVYVVARVPVLALEFDGDVHRVSRTAFLHDRAKDLALREAGCATLRFTFEQVARPERFVADVRRALAAAELTVPARTRGVA
jgi:hypothetical protein